MNSITSSLNRLLMPHQNMFNRIDSNSDNSVSKEEFVSNRPKNVSEKDASNLFDTIDKQKTGSLNAQQLKSGLDENRPKNEVRNNGNVLNSSVMGALLQITDDASGQNANEPTGEVSNAGGPPPKDGPPPKGGPPPPKSGGNSGESEASKTTNYDKLDTNKDGKISTNEILAGLDTAAQNSDNSSTKALLNGISDAIKTYAANNNINLDEVSAFSKTA